MLAAKTALAARVDALGEDSGTAVGIENRAKLEMRLKSLEENQVCSHWTGDIFAPLLSHVFSRLT